MAAPAPVPPDEDEPPDTDDLDEPEGVEERKDPGEDTVQPGRQPTVTQALSLVMGDVQSISKNSRNTSQNFNFRGIDAVMNAVGPALREHGVVVVPIKTKYEVEHYETKARENRSPTAMKNITLTVTFRFYGPAGDHIDATATGEAADSGDKAMPKAHSVAFRTMLLQALCIPTDEPDPDLESHDRAAQPFREGASAQDPPPRARERRVERPAYNFPKDWPELISRMVTLLGAEEALVWMDQAKTVATGSSDKIAVLSDAEKRQVWDVLTKVLRSLDDELKVDPNAFPPPTRDEIAGEFAKHLDGQILAGPRWALSAAEAEDGYPSKEEVTSPPDDEQPVPEPSDEEQQTLADEIAAEEAAAAAAADE